MKSSRSGKQAAEPGRIPWHAVAGSLALHGLVLASLAATWPSGETGVPPARPLRAVLREAVQLASEPAAAMPLPAMPVPQAVPRPERRVPPVLEATAAVTPAPTFSGEPASATALSARQAATGGEAVATDAALAPSVALAPAVADRGLPDAAGLREYRLALAGEARRHRRYPETARRQGLSGTAEIRIAISPLQRQAELARSSGYPQLDAAALEMLERAAATTPLPESLRERRFAVLLPVVFEVED